MASPPGAGGSRYVGRVVDPDVREDGALEPEVELNPAEPGAGEAPAGDPESTLEAGGGTDPLPRGAGVRSRLLARARAREGAPNGADESALDGELDAVGRPNRDEGHDDPVPLPAPNSNREPSAPVAPRSASELSPTLVAIFSALGGVALIASLTALSMSLEDRAARLRPPVSEGPTASVVAPPIATTPPKPTAKRERHKIPGPWRVSDDRADPRYRFVEGKVGNAAFLKALSGAGVPEAQGYRVLAAMRGVFDLDKCGKNDRFQALYERGSGKLVGFEYLVGAEEIYQAKPDAAGRLKGAKLDLAVERDRVVGVLVYDGSSFDHSAEQAGFDPGLSKVVARALDGHMALDELERGDMLRVIVQEVTVLGEFARYSGVEALDLVRADPKRSKFRVYYLDAPGVRGYYDHDGRAPFEGGWRKPIKDAPRTSPFNPKRMHPVLHKIMPHQGTDFGAHVGTPVGAASFGTVTFVGNGGPSGNLVKVMHPGGIETGYAHLSRFASGIRVGDKVKRMQIVGYVGSTGRSTGPHLHFSASRDGVFFDAETLNLDGLRTLTRGEREQFTPLMAKYDPMLDAIALPAPLSPLPAATLATAPAPAVSAPAPLASAALGPDPEEEEQIPPPAPLAAPPPATSAPANGKSSVYLTDKELEEMQGATDDGEIVE